MPLFSPAVAFLDLETTGTRAAADRVTEVGIVRVCADPAGGPPTVDEWASLVDPGVPIPPVIQALTGITDAMVRRAPSFASLAREISERLQGCVFVAHNARFDYGFLKHEFARLGQPFSAKVMCTVKLSRRLFPEAPSHGLDAIIERHALQVGERHRALGDARALWMFVQAVYASFPEETVDAVTRRILRTPSLPPQLPPDALDRVPEGPGVYLFYGDNLLPLYVGKSLNLRERVGAHFSGDWQSETDLRLSAEIRRIEVRRTAGELGALITEANLVKAMMPAHNRTLRRKTEAGVMRLDARGLPQFVPAAAIDPRSGDAAWGPFSSRRGMRTTLAVVASEHRLCCRRLGLEPGQGPCFARQLHRCEGVCDGAEAPEAHDARLGAALEPYALPRWPHAGPALIREASLDGESDEVHVVRDWSWLGTARDEGELAELLRAPPQPAFDPDVTRLLLRLWAKQPSAFRPAAVQAQDAS